MDFIASSLTRARIPFKRDRAGILGRLGPKRPGKPALVFVAHTDHPALVLRRPSPSMGEGKGEGGSLGLWEAEPLGDLPLEFMAGSNLRLYRPGPRGAMEIGRARLPKPGKSSGKPLLSRSRPAPLLIQVPALARAGDFCPAWPGALSLGKNWIKARALDDLAGCAAILTALLSFKTKIRKTPEVWAAFTRAEEVGLVGATDLALRRRIPRSALVISVEMSRALASARPGRGCVIRLGDRAGLFNPESSSTLAARARELSPRIPTQPALLSGGTCEATSFKAFGYKTAGLACPLLGYHNRDSLRKRPCAEKIAVSDYLSLVALIKNLMLLPLPDPIPAAPRLKALREKYLKNL